MTRDNNQERERELRAGRNLSRFYEDRASRIRGSCLFLAGLVFAVVTSAVLCSYRTCNDDNRRPLAACSGDQPPRLKVTHTHARTHAHTHTHTQKHAHVPLDFFLPS